MTPERWQKIKEIFDRALATPPGERATFLRKACADDPAIETEVESLLRANASAEGFLETPPASRIREALAQEAPALRSRIGPYEIVRELGHGGMGTVYLATRADDEFHQTVALKLVRRGMDTDFILRKFRGERQILAALEHPHIARLLDGGSTEDGLPYFVMEYIPGRHLLQECDERRLSTRERLFLFQQVCSAVAYAHRHLVVHRDIKPSNILVTCDGVPKLLDFGLAKLLQPELLERNDRTETAWRFLTPEYASPEQVRSDRITTASDVYSLGIVLYELLTGHRPFRVAGQRPDQIARAICEEEPEKPSTAVGWTEVLPRDTGGQVEISPSSVSATRDGDLQRLRRNLRGDLDNIVLMALRKEPERRYRSVDGMSEDIRRHLDGRPVLARKDTVAYRTGKFVARHKAAVGAAALVIGLVVGAGVVALQQARVARAERAAAEQHFNDVRQLANSFLFEFHDSIRNLPGSTPARQLVVRRALEYLEKLSSVKSNDLALQRELAEAYERVARVQGGLFESHLGDTQGALSSLSRARAIRESLAGLPPQSSTDQRSLAETLLQLAQVQMTSNDASPAVPNARRAVEILTSLSRASPADRPLRARVARARRYLGSALSVSDRERAMAELRSAASTFQALVQSEPSSVGYRRELGLTHQVAVHVLAGTAEREAALESSRKAVLLQEELIREEPGNFALRRELSYTELSTGTFLEWGGDMKGALEHYRKAMTILEGLVEADPRNADVRLSLAEAYNSFGYGQVRTGKPQPALENLRRSLRLYDSIVAADPANQRAQLGLARLYDSFGTALEALAAKARGDEQDRRLREARDWYEKCRTTYHSLPAERFGAHMALELASADQKLRALKGRLEAPGARR